MLFMAAVLFVVLVSLVSAFVLMVAALFVAFRDALRLGVSFDDGGGRDAIQRWTLECDPAAR